MTRRSASLLVAGSFVALASAAGPAAAATLPSDKVAEPAIMGGPNDVEYLRKIHAHVHKRWADNFLALIGQNLALGNPLNDAARVAEVDVVISAAGQARLGDDHEELGLRGLRRRRARGAQGQRAVPGAAAGLALRRRQPPPALDLRARRAPLLGRRRAAHRRPARDRRPQAHEGRAARRDCRAHRGRARGRRRTPSPR